jgi:RecA DNA recombination protein
MAQPLTRSILEEPPALSRLRSSLPETLRSHIRSARELDRELRDAAGEGAFPTGLPAIDRLLDGGLPRGQLVELVGSRTSGRFSTLLAVLAGATSVGEAAALVDLGDGLDPDAALGAGVDLDRLLWARPARLKEALAATEMLIDGGFPLVVLDLGNPPVRGGRGVEAAWLRLARAARAHDSALLVGAPYRVSGTAAGVVLKAGRSRAAWRGGAGSPWLLTGAASRIEIEKHRGKLPGHGEELNLVTAAAPRPAAPVVATPPKPQLRPREEVPANVAPFVRRAASA